MSATIKDLVIIGAGPVGLMSAYLAKTCGLDVVTIDRSDAPLALGRADALNARTLQMFALVGLLAELYPKGKPCNTSSIWRDGAFVSRQSTWWQALQGCLHKHFLMLGQAHVEQIIDERLTQLAMPVRRSLTVENIELEENICITTLSNGERIYSKYVIGADGSRSFVRSHFQVPFAITRPEMVWAVIDGAIKTDFPKVPEIIVFQGETADVAWIPREADIDRFYIRMDKENFSKEEVVEKINAAMSPHQVSFERVDWFSQFSVKESVAQSFCVKERVFLAGDACHIHSVNGGQGLNTGLSDAFNLIWKLAMVLQNKAAPSLLHSYQTERKPVAESVIETSAALVRATKYSKSDTHAEDYVKIVERQAGNITGMGIRYESEGLVGTRVWDFMLTYRGVYQSLYALLDYRYFSLLVFSEQSIPINTPNWIQVVTVLDQKNWLDAEDNPLPYAGQAILVRPDAYIAAVFSLQQLGENVTTFVQSLLTPVNNSVDQGIKEGGASR